MYSDVVVYRRLFQNKGWTTIITDDLSDNVLWLMSIGIGLASGLVGFIMGAADQDMFSGIGYDQNGGTVGFMYVSRRRVVFAIAVASSFSHTHPHLFVALDFSWAIYSRAS